MPRGWRVIAGVLACLSQLAVSETRDQLAARNVMGPHWKQIARSAGTIFAGTVLAVENAPPTGRNTPVVQVRFRVERAIAGSREGQTFTLREWSGAWGAHPPMRRGQRLLIFLYPPSRLGLSSPVGAELGQIPLDFGSEAVTARAEVPHRVRTESARQPATATTTGISIRRLERAIRSVRAGE